MWRRLWSVAAATILAGLVVLVPDAASAAVTTCATGTAYVGASYEAVSEYFPGGALAYPAAPGSGNWMYVVAPDVAALCAGSGSWLGDTQSLASGAHGSKPAATYPAKPTVEAGPLWRFSTVQTTVPQAYSTVPDGTCVSGSAFAGWTYGSPQTLTAADVAAWPKYPEVPPAGTSYFLAFPAGQTPTQVCQSSPNYTSYTSTSQAGAHGQHTSLPAAGNVVYPMAQGAGSWVPSPYNPPVAPTTPSPSPSPVASPVSSPAVSPSPAPASTPPTSSPVPSGSSSATAPCPSASSAATGTSCVWLAGGSSTAVLGDSTAFGLYLFLGANLMLSVFALLRREGRGFRG